MKRTLATAFILVGLVTPALAAEHYAMKDTENYCSVIDATPSPGERTAHGRQPARLRFQDRRRERAQK